MDNDNKKPIAIDRLVLGLVLLTVGALAFTAQVDLWDPRQIARLWPLFLIVLGLAGEVEALRKRRSDGSATLMAVGIWLMVGINHWFGLTVGSALPIGVSVVGAFVVLHALVDVPKQSRRENGNEQN